MTAWLYLLALMVFIGLSTSPFTYSDQLYATPRHAEAPIHDVELLYGKDITWTTLLDLARPMSAYRLSSNMFIGNFDTDPDSEVVIISRDRQALLVNLNGEKSAIDLPEDKFAAGGRGWDFNGDGIDELIPSDSIRMEFYKTAVDDYTTDTPYDSCPIYYLSGMLAYKIPHCYFRTGMPLEADVNGDDRLELIGVRTIRRQADQNELPEYSSQVIAWTTYCQEAYQVDSESQYFFAAGDIDGDGKAEFLSKRYGPQANDIPYLIANGVEQDAVRISQWSSSWNEWWPTGEIGLMSSMIPCTTSLEPEMQCVDVGLCADITGDGVDEIINVHGGYLDTARQELVAWQFPDNLELWLDDTYVYCYWDGIEVDVDDNGANDLVFYAPGCKDVAVFGASGSCMSWARFSDAVIDGGAVEYQGKRLCVLLTETQLLVSQ